MRISDWSSDVCSSDLVVGKSFARRFRTAFSRRSRRRIGGATCDTETGDGRESHCARDGAEEALVLGDHILSPLLMRRSEEHTSELQSLMRISYAVFCLKKKLKITTT